MTFTRRVKVIACLGTGHGWPVRMMLKGIDRLIT
jgi:hypothetical protein